MGNRKSIDVVKIEVEGYKELIKRYWNEDFTDEKELLCLKFYQAGVRIHKNYTTELEKCNKLLAEVNLNNAGKISELENRIEDLKCCGNCSWWSERICTNTEWCIRAPDKNDMCIRDLWQMKDE